MRTMVPANETVVFTLTMKPISSSSVKVSCFMKLYDAQHLMLDEKVFNVTTDNAEVSSEFILSEVSWKPHGQMLGQEMRVLRLFITLSHSHRELRTRRAPV